MIVVTTPTGHVGHRVVELLLDRGEPVRVIARDPSKLAPAAQEGAEVIAGSHADPAVLDAALAGADALFLVVPPNGKSDSVEGHYLAYAREARAAVERAGVGHVVAISTMGGGPGFAGDASRAGQLSAALAMDAELGASGAAYRAVAAPFFMENLLGQADALRGGVLALPSDPDRALPLVATADLAAKAADLLAARDWSGTGRVPVSSPDALTPTDVAAALAESLGREVAYRQVAPADYGEMLRGFGLSPAWSAGLTAMAEAQNAGFYEPDLAAARGVGPTALREWSDTFLRPALEA
jgi:uncharacterized protein YbjT (DUF2867 family)